MLENEDDLDEVLCRELSLSTHKAVKKTQLQLFHVCKFCEDGPCLVEVLMLSRAWQARPRPD